MSHDALTFATFRPSDPGDLSPERVDGWLEAHSRGFHGPRVGDELRKHFNRHIDADDVLLRGVWQDESAVGSGAIPVATYSSFQKTLNAGGPELVPLHMISDITVSPTHRRRGLLRSLITEDLRDAAERELPIAALTASEGSIYGRFGFGRATLYRTIEVDTGPRFALRANDDEGSIELVEPAEAWPAVQAVFARFHERTRGSVDRPQFYEPILTGAFDFREGPDKTLRAAVHLGRDGEPDGYATYKPGERTDKGRQIEVQDLVALGPQAYLRLWRFLADIDLSTHVVWEGAPVDDPLEWALVDPRLVTVTKLVDRLWVRVLDVPAALQARCWGADGSVVLDVADPLGHAHGRFRVATSGGGATVEPTDDDAEIGLDAETLGSLYLGGVRVDTLQLAGRVRGTTDAVARWADMADVGPAPYCITGF